MPYRPLEQAFPIGNLKVAALNSAKGLGEKVDSYLAETRKGFAKTNSRGELFDCYEKESYLLNLSTPRFGSGEGKAQLNETVRGSDLFILADPVNASNLYKINNADTFTSPDDNFQDLKRVIAACSGKPTRINLIMPFLYEGRRDNRTQRESLDCSIALNELLDMGVKNIITFDAHEPRVENSIPLEGFDNFNSSLQFIHALLEHDKELMINDAHLMTVSPDENGTNRAIYYANMLGINTGMFYKRFDYSRVIDGVHPVLAYEFLGGSVEGKTVMVIDDMISSGEPLLETAKALKARKADKVYLFATYGLFSEGFDEFDKAYEMGVFDHLFTTNLTHVPDTLREKSYYTEVDMSRYLATIINCINHDSSIESIIDPAIRIQELLKGRR